MNPEPLALSVAPNGARRTRADHPALPITAQELAATARDCLAAGAAMIHLHVRDREGRHVLDVEAYRSAIRAIRQAVGRELVIQVTTEAVGRYSPAEQMELVRQLEPEAVSLALAELIPDADHEQAAGDFLRATGDAGVIPQFILYSPAEVARFRQLRRAGIVPAAGHGVLFVLGRYSKPRCGHPRELIDFVHAHDPDTPWAVCAFGPGEHACGIAAAALGGHVRVGFENNLWLRDGSVAPDNAALVAQMREAAQFLRRPLATAGDLRAPESAQDGAPQNAS